MESLFDVGFTDFVCIEGSLWFCDIFTGNILRINLETDEVFLEAWTDQSEQRGKMQYGLAEKINEHIFFIPRNATTILDYNIEEKTKEYIELKMYGKKFSKPLFLSLCRYEDYLYLVPGRYSSIVRLNTKTRQVDYYPVDKSNVEVGRELLFNSNAILVGEKLFVKNCKDSSFLTFDVNSGEQNLIEIEIEDFQIFSALKSEGDILLAGLSSKIFLYDVHNGELSWIDNYMNVDKPQYGFCRLLQCENIILAVAINQPRIYRVSIENREIEKWIEFDYFGNNISVFEMFTQCDIIGAKLIGDRVVMFSTVRNAVIEINVNTKEVKYHDTFVWETQNMKEYTQKYLEKNKVVYEGSIMLKQFIEFVSE